MGGLGHEDEGPRLLLHRLETERHVETVGRLGEGRLHSSRLGIRARDELDSEEELQRIGGGELLGLGDVGPE